MLKIFKTIFTAIVAAISICSCLQAVILYNLLYQYSRDVYEFIVVSSLCIICAVISALGIAVVILMTEPKDDDADRLVLASGNVKVEFSIHDRVIHQTVTDKEKTHIWYNQEETRQLLDWMREAKKE